MEQHMLHHYREIEEDSEKEKECKKECMAQYLLLVA